MNENKQSCIDQDEEALRKDLIQRATTRLRHRLLEQSLQEVLHEVVSLQTELESLRLDATVTLDSVSVIALEDTSTDATLKLNRQLDVLERRLDTHKSTLACLKRQPELKKEEEESKPMSRLSSLSLMSSLFTRSHQSSRATSVNEEDEDDHPFYDLAGKHSFGAGSFCGSVYGDDTNMDQSHCIPLPCSNQRYTRRQRRQRRQSVQDTMSSDDDALSVSAFSTTSSIVEDDLQHPLSPPPCYQALSLHSPYLYEKQLYPQRNVLDEAMSFLDGISENGDDGGFGEDMYFLLQNPDLCCRPLSEIESTMKLYQRDIQVLNSTSWAQSVMKYSGIKLYDITCTSLDWCRFISVLSAAVVISLMKGPEEIKRPLIYHTH